MHARFAGVAGKLLYRRFSLHLLGHIFEKLGGTKQTKSVDGEMFATDSKRTLGHLRSTGDSCCQKRNATLSASSSQFSSMIF